ncbi:MAG: hypothetical protein LLG20_27630 [Acidobacteriales bacterium]|nr:hypothetical protein [Terriglobales bacterium]
MNGNLVIRNGALSTPGPDGGAGIYRPINLSGPVTVSATLTPGNGYGGLLNRYGTGVLFGSNGDLSSGYGVWLYRADQNYSNSQVILLLNGTELASVPSSFQFGASVTAMVTFSPDGSLKGSVSGSGSIFNFSFGPRTMVLPASNIMISLGFPDGRSSVITHPTVDNLIVSYSCNPGPPELNLVKVTPLLTNGKYMALSCSDLPDPPAGYDWWLYNLALEIPTWDWNWRAFRAGGSGPTKPCIDNNYIWDLSSPGLIPSDSDVYLLVFALSQSIPDLPVKDAHYWPGNNPVYYGVVHWNGTSGTVK